MFDRYFRLEESVVVRSAESEHGARLSQHFYVGHRAHNQDSGRYLILCNTVSEQTLSCFLLPDDEER